VGRGARVHAIPWHGARWWMVPPCRAGSGGGRMSSMRPVVGLSVGWGGGEAASRPADQPPPPHGPPDDEPGTTTPDRPDRSGRHTASGADDGRPPAQGPAAVGDHPAAAAHGQGDPLGGLDDPAGPPDLQRLGRRPPGPEGAGRWRPAAAPPNRPARWVAGDRLVLTVRVLGRRLRLAVQVQGGRVRLAAGSGMGCWASPLEP
jgi:hypothetical protein